MWKAIRDVADDNNDGVTHDALYEMGCKMQELEAYIEKLEARIKALEKRK